jgi:A/G-specific adenine glycosylase
MLPPDPRAFRRALLSWYHSQKRALPWRDNTDPYRVWVSEIMLQQTRVAAVIPYFERFLAKFPTVAALARSPEQKLLAAWAGLGYYARARNLQKAARQIVQAGGFPTDYATIRALAGVGEYTAAAVASIAFGLPYAAVDGNVRRVLSRITAETGDIQTSAEALLEAKHPGDYNQAMMELGATVCLPRQPLCLLCPVAGFCAALKAGLQNNLPARVVKSAPKRVSKQLLILERRGRILLWQRPAESPRLASFWELPERQQLNTAQVGACLGKFRHTIVNTLHEITVFAATTPDPVGDGFVWLPNRRLQELPLSTTAKKALRLRSLTRRSS